MNNLFFKIKSALAQKRGFLVFVVCLTLLAIVLAIVSAINIPSDVYEVDLSNIAYIQFLSGDCGFMSMTIKMLLSMLIFILLIMLCGTKKHTFFLGIVFYLYLIYSQIFVIVNIILIYGFVNCLVLMLFLCCFAIVVSMLFICFLIELRIQCGCANYFKMIFNRLSSNIIFYLFAVFVITILFCLILLILKSFVLVLVF